MKRIAFLVITLFFSLKSMAGDGDKFFNISGGWQWKNTVHAVVGLEFEVNITMLMNYILI
ncbi:Uncharacterised protein [Bacteroides fragilis NCTC 9343]|nr:Uncharacterised protein [Bacteroides fragilis NCTC 9343]